MAKKFQPKDQYLQNLVKGFEQSIKEDTNFFVSEDELEKLIDFYESLPDYTKAIMAVDKAIDLFQFSSNFHIKRAQLLLEIKDFDGAWQSLDAARAFEPVSSELLLTEADLLSAEGNYKEAIENLYMLLSIVSEENMADVYLEMADIYEASNNGEELAKTLQVVIQQYPENEEAIHRYFTLLSQIDQLEDGIETFKTSIDKRPYNFLAWYYLGKCYEEIGLYEKAINAYEYTIAINDYYFAYWDYAGCFQAMGEWDKAISTFYDMLELFENDENVYFEIGHCYREKNDFALAKKAYNAVLDQASDIALRAKAHFYIGKTYFKQEQFKLALRQYEKAAELNSKKTKYANAVGKLNFQLGNIEDAANSYIQSLAINDEQDKIWRNLAQCYFELGFKDVLIEALSKAVSILPENAQTQYYFAAYLLHYGHLQQGLNHLETALTLDSTQKNSIFALFPELESNNVVLDLMNQY